MKHNAFTTIGLIGLLIGLSLLTICLTDKYILTADFYIAGGDIFDESPARELQMYSNLGKWIYFFSAVYLIIKIAVISLLLGTACYLNDLDVPYRKIMNVVAVSELIFLLPAAVKIFHFYGTSIDRQNWNSYYFLSAMQLFHNIPSDWILVFQTLNLFEFAYWFFLARGIFKIAKLSYDRSLRIVLYSYVPALFIWVVTVTFCSVLLFPQNA
jgi:hypothetical protein